MKKKIQQLISIAFVAMHRRRLRLGAVEVLHPQLHGQGRRLVRRELLPSSSGRSPFRRRLTVRSSPFRSRRTRSRWMSSTAGPNR